MSEQSLTDCPECGKEIRRIINGGSGVIFKGSGFYVTDKKTGSAKPAAKETKDGKKPDDKKGAEKPACASCPAAAASGGNCAGEARAAG